MAQNNQLLFQATAVAAFTSIFVSGCSSPRDESKPANFTDLSFKTPYSEVYNFGVHTEGMSTSKGGVLKASITGNYSNTESTFQPMGRDSEDPKTSTLDVLDAKLHTILNDTLRDVEPTNVRNCSFANRYADVLKKIDPNEVAAKGEADFDGVTVTFQPTPTTPKITCHIGKIKVGNRDPQ